MKRLAYILLNLTLSFGALGNPSDTSKIEWIKPYFNASADHSYALPGNESRDEWDMIGVLVDCIDSAKFSVDLVAYDLQNMRVGSALARAARRGVQVRVITDVIHRHHAPKYTQPMWDTLRAAGIPNIDDSGTIYWPDGEIEHRFEKLPNSGANMHHKFAVFDLLSEDPEDYHLWTGTMNVTYTGPWNTNATLHIKDSGIARAYFEEFEQMWGSDEPEPNARRARFHKDKDNVSENVHHVNDTRVEVYFGPMDRRKTKPSISARITELIEDYAKHDARFLAFAISSNIPISQALIKRSGRGEINLQGVIDPAFYARYRNNGDIWASPEMAFGNRLILPAKEVRKLHSKTMIIDAQYPYPEKHDALTITGSYNFSAAAERANDENILFIFDNKITNQYLQDFMGVMSRAKGESFHRYPTVDTTKWYDQFRVVEGDRIEVELATKFYYPVDLLGVDAPRTWGGHEDSTYYYSAASKNYLKTLLKGASLRIVGPRGLPRHKYGSYKAYVQVKKGDSTFHLNRTILSAGHADYSEYYYQPGDSAMAFQIETERARQLQRGMWEKPTMVGQKIITKEAAMLKDLFPLNVNTATLKQLQFLPTVGPGRAQKILDYRDQNGKFDSLNELDRIPGIGPATLKKLEPLVVFE